MKAMLHNSISPSPRPPSNSYSPTVMSNEEHLSEKDYASSTILALQVLSFPPPPPPMQKRQ